MGNYVNETVLIVDVVLSLRPGPYACILSMSSDVDCQAELDPDISLHALAYRRLKSLTSSTHLAKRSILANRSRTADAMQQAAYLGTA